MEKKKFLRRTFALVLAALMLFAFVSFLTGCSKKITQGEVVNKTFSPAHVQTMVVPVCISNGKTMTTYFIPYVYKYSDTWTITISGQGEDGKTESATFRVTKEVFDAVPLGAEFIYKPEMEPSKPEYRRERSTGKNDT